MSQESNRKDELITRKNPRSLISEAFRSVRTNLSFMNPDSPLESIVITSPGAGEGKSVVTANLAVSMAQNDQKVIILDADTRRPMQHHFFELEQETGMNSFLTGKRELEGVLQETEIDNLSIITSGEIPPNPAELIASDKMSELIERIEEKADFVLIDTPPAAIVTEPVILARDVDGIILVVASGETKQDMLKTAQENLEKVQGKILGTVLNKYPAGKSRYYNKYYYDTGYYSD